jgi:hypothetical protein
VPNPFYVIEKAPGLIPELFYYDFVYAGLGAGVDSVLAGAGVAGVDVEDALALALSVLSREVPWPDGERLSVAYQPEPLKMMPVGVNTLRSDFFPHSGHFTSGASVKLWCRSNCTPHSAQR